jgi:phosphate uptake regulator
MIEADESHILVANLIEHDAIDPKKIIERMGMLVKSMIYDLYEAAFTGDLGGIKDMRFRDTDIDRIYWLTSRQYSIYQKDVSAPHKMGLPLYEMTACLFLSKVLEGIGDHAVTIADRIMLMTECCNTILIDKESHKLGQRMTDLLTKSVKSWIEKDIILAEQAIKEADLLIREAIKQSAANKTTIEGSIPINEVMMVTSKRIAEFCKGIAEFAFNLSME